MEYYLIKGYFHVVGYSPDGDSLMFEAKNKKQWNKIVTNFRELFDEKLKTGKGVVQLRLQGIDALETHYTPSNAPVPKGLGNKKSKKAIKPIKSNLHQPGPYGMKATDNMLSMFGVVPESTSWRKSGWGGAYISKIEVNNGKRSKTYKAKNKDPLEGYIIVNDMDRKGRPISWVFAGKTRIKDGTRMTDSKVAAVLKQSANYKLVSNGLVYPYFFFTLAAKLRNILMHAVINAQRQKMNIWSVDETANGIRVSSFSKITEQHVILPYLFRRLVKHQYLRMMQGYYDALKKRKSYTPKSRSLFLDSFYEDTNPYVFMIKESEFKRLDQIVKVTKTKIKMTTHPGNIVFLS